MFHAATSLYVIILLVKVVYVNAGGFLSVRDTSCVLALKLILCLHSE